jgi:predicted RNA-binding Zn-ribbon protein involved in translation (DUF1610 family)
MASATMRALPTAKHGQVSTTAWLPSSELGYRDWRVEGRRIGVIGRGSDWWIGDWLLYGTAKWGERYSEAAKLTGYDPKTLRNMRYVSSRFDVSLRRDDLTWSHHALLASLERDAQAYWLQRASEDRLSVADLRLELRAEQHGASEGARQLTPRECSPATVIVCPNCGEAVPIRAPEVNRRSEGGHPAVSGQD